MDVNNARKLCELAEISDLYIATARNAPSVQGLVQQLNCSSQFAGFVLECGYVARTRLEAVNSISEPEDSDSARQS